MPEVSHRHSPVIGAELERCIYCQGTKIRRKGMRRKKLETVQLWYCRECNRTFTPQRAKGRTYPLKVILEALMLYYRGETREHTSKRIGERFGIAVPARTLSTWLAEYREPRGGPGTHHLCAIARHNLVKTSERAKSRTPYLKKSSGRIPYFGPRSDVISP